MSKKDERAAFGVIGLGVMGENLALNIEEHAFPVAVWNRDGKKTQRFLSAHAGKRLTGADTLEGLVRSLQPPRRILMMIPAGGPVDQTIHNLEPLLDPGDILIDGGNSDFRDTERREGELRKSGLHFFGLGVSGGERGARQGPSLMPGGDRAAYERLRPVLETVAAKTEYGPCVGWIGPGGAGHFVKTVHNGIEYGVMQVIAEGYDILRKAVGLKAPEIGRVFAEWNRGPLESFLMDLTAEVLTVTDAQTGRPLVDLVLDSAGRKGTGRWSVEIALDLDVAVPVIAAALDARVLSSMKSERIQAAAEVRPTTVDVCGLNEKSLVPVLQDAIYSAVVCAYAEGFRLIRSASDDHRWGLNPKEIARIWTGGCIIRAGLLAAVMRAYEENPNLPSLFLDEEINGNLRAAQAGWRAVVGTATALGIPVPALSASLAYFDGYRTADLPQNLTQAQRDAFGSHTYQRSDRPDEGFVHTDWLGLAGDSKDGA